jgi:hypothetical protein
MDLSKPVAMGQLSFSSRSDPRAGSLRSAVIVDGGVAEMFGGSY